MSQTLPTKTKTAATEGFQPRPLARIDKALSLIRQAGIPLPTGENSTVAISGLVKDLLPYGETEVTAIVRTLNQIQVFNEIVREHLDQTSVGERYIRIAKDFTSIRDDSKRMLAQIEDGKLSLGDRVGNQWMLITRGSIPKRFNRIREVAKDIQRAGEDTAHRLREILKGYAEARLGLQEARILADDLRKKTRAAWETAQAELTAANDELTRLRETGAEARLINEAELKRDEGVRDVRETERLFQISEDLYNNLSVSYEAGDAIMTRVAQTAEVQERVWSQSVVFFNTNETVLTALSASFTGIKSLHETTQGHEALKNGINEALGDLATTGTTVMEAGLRSGYGPTISAEAVKKVVDAIIDFQERSYAIKDEMRAQAAKNEQEMRVVMEDGRQRLTKLLTNPPKPAA